MKLSDFDNMLKIGTSIFHFYETADYFLNNHKKFLDRYEFEEIENSCIDLFQNSNFFKYVTEDFLLEVKNPEKNIMYNINLLNLTNKEITVTFGKCVAKIPALSCLSFSGRYNEEFSKVMFYRYKSELRYSPLDRKYY